MDCLKKGFSKFYSINLLLDFSDIVHWKNPSLTIAFLILLNVAYLVFKSLHVSVISSIAHKLFFLGLIMLAKEQLFGKSSE